MSIVAGQQAIIDHLYTLVSTANLMVEEANIKSLPRYVAVVQGGVKSTVSVDGAVTDVPSVLIRVETETENLTTESDGMVEALENHFSPGTKFGGFTVVTPPDVRAPIGGDTGVRSIPVFITATRTS